MKDQSKFQVGDVVIACNGSRPATITGIYGNAIYAKYNHNGAGARYNHGGIKHYEENTMSNNSTLYSIKKEDGTVTYGVHVGTDSANRFLMEEKGTGQIILANKSQLEEVLPYTFSVRMNGKTVHFQGEPGKVKKNDVLLYTGDGADKFEIAMVTGVDTKNKGAAKTFSGRKLATEDI